MRFLGVRVDEEKAKTFGDTLKKKQTEILKTIKKTGLDIEHLSCRLYSTIVRSSKDYRL